MPPARRKAARIAAPSTITEATSLLGEYMGALAQIEQLKADADAAIVQIEAARDGFVAPVEQRAKELFLQLRTWWAVAAPDLTEGKRKSIELAGCLIGERTTPPSLQLPKGVSADDAVLIIKELGLDYTHDALRVKESIDKPAVLKLLGTDPLPDAAAQLAARGFKLSRREEFFIDRAGKPEADPVEVQDGECVA